MNPTDTGAADSADAAASADAIPPGDAAPADTSTTPETGTPDACVPPLSNDADVPDIGPVAPWVQTSSGGEIVAIARDRGGNVYVTGSAGGAPFYLAKFDPRGTLLWSKALGSNYVYEHAIAIDGAGNAIVVGELGNGAIDFGGGPVPAGGYVVRYSPEGDFVSQMTFPGGTPTDNSAVATVEVLSSGEMVISGSFAGTIDFGGTSLTASGQRNVFVARYDVCGHLVFVKAFGFGTDADAYPTSLLRNATDDLLLTGIFGGTFDFGCGVLTGSPGYWTIFVAKLDSLGKCLASNQFSDTSSYGQPSATTLDHAGNLLITGYFDNTVDFGGGPLVSAGSRDVYIAKLGPTLEYVWAKRFGDPQLQEAYAVATDDADDVIFTGRMTGTVDFGTGPLQAPANDYPLFVAKLAPSGTTLSARIATGDDYSNSDGYALAPTETTDMILGGNYVGAFSFGPASFPSGNGTLLMRFAP